MFNFVVWCWDVFVCFEVFESSCIMYSFVWKYIVNCFLEESRRRRVVVRIFFRVRVYFFVFVVVVCYVMMNYIIGYVDIFGVNYNLFVM